jgi:ElaB/YqjD/DUF883 family membrane-anchored ribosome-binding protein
LAVEERKKTPCTCAWLKSGRRQEEQRGASSRSASRADPASLSRAETTLFRTKIASCFSIVELVHVATVSLKEDAGKSVYSVCRFSLIEWDGSRLYSSKNMDEHQKPEEAVESGKDHLRAAAGNLKEAASAKVEEIRHAAEQKAEELRSATQSKAQELKGTAESWQAEGHAYIRDNPTKSVLIALGLGLLLGLLFRK